LSDLPAIAQQPLVAGRLTNCTTMCGRILRRHPDHPEALHLLGLVAHQSGQLGTAIEYLRRATTTAPQVARYRANLGEMYRLAGRIEDAIAEGKRSIALDPAYVEAYSNVGVALFDRGAYAEPPTFTSRRSQSTDFVSACQRSGQALVELGRWRGPSRRAASRGAGSEHFHELGKPRGFRFMGEYEATVVLWRIALDPVSPRRAGRWAPPAPAWRLRRGLEEIHGAARTDLASRSRRYSRGAATAWSAGRGGVEQARRRH
jgi:hypothetical protein